MQDTATLVQDDIEFFADVVPRFGENIGVFDMKVDCRPRPPAQVAVGCGTEKLEVGGGMGAVEDPIALVDRFRSGLRDRLSGLAPERQST